MIIYPYKPGSSSVKNLCQAMAIKQIKLEGSKFKGSPSKLVINWGSSQLTEEVKKCTLLNSEEAVKLVSNKKSFFEKAKGEVSIPEFTTDHEQVVKWLEDGKKVVARTKLSGHSGDGIHVLKNLEDWDKVDKGAFKIFVLYVPKKLEYRVHMSKGGLIDIQRKILKPGIKPDMVNWDVRNHINGFVYVRNNVKENCPKCVFEEASKAIEVSGLDFGAVDVIYNAYHKKAYVLEINTAPGLEGTSVDNYKELFEGVYEEFQNEGGIDWVHIFEEKKKMKVHKPFFQPDFAIEEVVNIDFDNVEEDMF